MILNFTHFFINYFFFFLKKKKNTSQGPPLEHDSWSCACKKKILYVHFSNPKKKKKNLWVPLLF